MTFLRSRFEYLFTSTRGLVLVAIALISLVTALFGTLSGPMEELGVKTFAVSFLGLRLIPAEREGRIIMLYHTIAMAVVAIETYLITALVAMRRQEQVRINLTITVGYIVSFFFGLGFAYFGHNFVFHGLFIFGQSLVFFAGVMLTWALNPWAKEYRTIDPLRSRTRGGLDLERMAFFLAAVATLGSVIFGAIPGSLFGNGFEAFLAEDILRQPEKTALELAVIGHLHIMLTLIAVMLTLIVGKWLGFKGKLHQAAMPLMIVGTLIITAGVWMVVPFERIAHIIINVGSAPVLVASALLTYYAWRAQIVNRLAQQGIARASFIQRIQALLHDPLKFGATWQMIYMNFVVTAVGVFMAIRLDPVIRQWTHREERVGLTGHWHILAGIIATILLLYYADLAGLKGRMRQWFGWAVIISSDIAFAAVSVFETRRLYASELNQQPLVDGAILVTDIGLMALLVTLAALMVWRLVDLFKNNGRWQQEMQQPGLDGEEVKL